MEFPLQAGANCEDSYKQFGHFDSVAQPACDTRQGPVSHRQAPLLTQQQWLRLKQQQLGVSGGSNSGSSTFSSEPGPDPAFGPPAAQLLAFNPQLEFREHARASCDPASSQSQELSNLLDSDFITEQQLQQHFRQQRADLGLFPQQQQQQLSAQVPYMLPGAHFSGDMFPLDPQRQQLLRQLSGSTQHSQHSQQEGQGGASTSSRTASPADAGGPTGGAAAGCSTSPAHSGQTPTGDEEHGADSGKYSLPVAHLKVACGDMVGTLLVHKARIRIYEGTDKEKEVSPTEFERLGGRSATKKWKQSIRLIGEDGGNGRPVGEWYVQMGLEAPKKPRDKDIHTANSPTVNVYLDRHERHANKSAAATAAAAAAAAAAPTPRARGLRSAKQTLAPAAAAAAAAGKGRRSRSGAAEDAAAAGSSWDEVGTAAFASSDGTAAAQQSGTLAFPQDTNMGGWGALYPQQQQQQLNMSGGGLPNAQASMQYQQAGSNPYAMGCPSALMSTEAPGGLPSGFDWPTQQQMQAPAAAAATPAAAAAAAYAAAVSGDYAIVPVPNSMGLPGDSSLAVVEMGAYLQGLRSTPPWRLLPITQRPLIGRQLVPLKHLFVMLLHLGGYHTVESDERLWQEVAMQLELPAWPTPEVPDPIRVLQQVYRDYLLRFETRFVLQMGPAAAVQSAGVGAGGGVGAGNSGGSMPMGLLQGSGGGMGMGMAAAGVGGAAGGSGMGSGGLLSAAAPRQDHSPALSTAATQYTTAAGAAAAAPPGMMPGRGAAGSTAGLVSAAADMLMAGDRATAAGGASGGQRGQQGLLMPGMGLQGTLSGMQDVFLNRSLSEDLMDVLTDLIPMPHDTGVPAAAAAGGVKVEAAGNGSGSTGSGNGSSAPERPGSLTLVQAMAAQELAARHARAGAGVSAAGTTAAAEATAEDLAIARQHPEMGQVQRRKQQQQLLAQLQAMASEVTAGAFAGAPGGTGSTSGGGTAGGTRLKRPPPLIRCGDSDLVNVMDQAEVERILREHDEQQQRKQQPGSSSAAAAAGQQQASAAGGGLSEALDAEWQDLLEGYLQQHDTAAQLQQQQEQLQQQQQQQQQAGVAALQVRQSEDAVSGMLEALQIEQQQQQQAVPPGLPQAPLQHQGTGVFLPQQYKLHMQQSVGAHLMSDLLRQQQQQESSGGSGNSSRAQSSGGRSSPATSSGQGVSGSDTRPSMPSGQQQQQGPQVPHGHAQGDAAALPGFAGGLLRLTTPNSALLGSVLESPTHRAPAGTQWMDRLELHAPEMGTHMVPSSQAAAAAAGTGHAQAGHQGPDRQQQQRQQQQQQRQQQQQQQERPGSGQAVGPDDVAALMSLW